MNKKEVLKEAKKLGYNSVIFDEEKVTYQFPIQIGQLSPLNPTQGHTEYYKVKLNLYE